MAAPDPHRQRDLRRLVAQMAGFSADDVALVLEGLDDDDRRIVEGLLRDYAGAKTTPIEPDAIARAGLSSWLLAIVRGGDAAGAGTAIMPRSREALAACARALAAERGDGPAIHSSPSLIERFVAGLRGRRVR